MGGWIFAINPQTALASKSQKAAQTGGAGQRKFTNVSWICVMSMQDSAHWVNPFGSDEKQMAQPVKGLRCHASPNPRQSLARS